MLARRFALVCLLTGLLGACLAAAVAGSGRGRHAEAGAGIPILSGTNFPAGR